MKLTKVVASGVEHGKTISQICVEALVKIDGMKREVAQAAVRTVNSARTTISKARRGDLNPKPKKTPAKGKKKVKKPVKKKVKR